MEPMCQQCEVVGERKGTEWYCPKCGRVVATTNPDFDWSSVDQGHAHETHD